MALVQSGTTNTVAGGTAGNAPGGTASGGLLNPIFPTIAPFLTGTSAPTTPPKAPSSGIASQTHTDAQGNSVKTTYAQPASTAPTVNTPSASNPTSNPNFNYMTPTNAAPAGIPQSTGTPLPSGQVTTAAGTGVSTNFGAGTPRDIASNLTAPGLLGNQIGQSQSLYQTQAGLINPAIQKNLDIIQQATQQEEQLTGGSYSGTAADYSGRMAQLENIKQAAQQNVNSASSNLATFSGQAQSALGEGVGAATNLVSSPYGQPQINPLSGASYSGGQSMGGAGGGGGNLDPQTQATNLAQQVMSGKLTYEQAMSSMGYAGNVGSTFLNQAITSAGGNPLQLQAQGAGQQAALQSIPGWQGANVAAQGIAQQIQQYIAQNPKLNPSQANTVNAIQQWAQGKQLSDPTYQTFADYLTEYVNTIAPVLGVGGDTTNLKTQISQGLISGTSQGQTIVQVLNNLSNNLATQKIQNYTSGVTGGGVVSSVPPSSSGGNTPPPSTTTSASGFGWSGQ